MARVTLKQAQAAKQTAVQRFDGLAEVVGVGITRIDGEYAVKVNVQTAVPEGTLPAEIDGVAVCVEVVGAIRRR